MLQEKLLIKANKELYFHDIYILAACSLPMEYI